jgi:hypothetical protein
VIVQLVQRVLYELENRGIVVQFPAGQNVQMGPGTRVDTWWPLPREHTGQSVKVIIDLQLALRLRKTGTISLLLRMSSWQAHGQLYLYEAAYTACLPVLVHEVRFENL